MNSNLENSNLGQTQSGIKAPWWNLANWLKFVLTWWSLALTQNHLRILIRIFTLLAFFLALGGIYQWHHGHHEFFGQGNSIVGQPNIVAGQGNLKMDELTIWGYYGSYLQGTTASLWSLAAFCMIFVGFLGQMMQIHKQTEDYDQQANQFQEQSESMKRQNFESSFFQLLTLHNNIVDGLAEINCKAEGRRLFLVLSQRLTHTYLEALDGKDLLLVDTEDFAIRCYEGIYAGNQDVLGHYFRNLYHVIKFVDDSEISDKKRYTSLVRAQISTFEHEFLYYNGLSVHGRSRFKPLIEKYAMLENLNTNLLLNPKHGASYSNEAFGEDLGWFNRHKISPSPTQTSTPETDAGSSHA